MFVCQVFELECRLFSKESRLIGMEVLAGKYDMVLRITGFVDVDRT